MLNFNTSALSSQSNLKLENDHFQSSIVKIEPSELCLKRQNHFQNNLQSGFLTHEQRIQATYNFQHLFRKKSQLYNNHKNKKKLLSKIKGKQPIINDEHDKQSKHVKKGHWTQQQNRKYHWFLQLNNKNFIYKHLRRTDKIFKAMSAFIGTRQAQQCRSHHQKMQKKFKHFYQIILKLRLQFYGTYSTQAVKIDLLQNGFIKQSKQLLIGQNIMKQVQNTKDLDHSSQKDDDKNQDNQFIHPIQQNDSNDSQLSDSNSEYKTKKQQVHMLLGENYEEELRYKMY